MNLILSVMLKTAWDEHSPLPYLYSSRPPLPGPHHHFASPLPQVELEVELDKEENEQKAYFLKNLQSLGVDMTQYMLAIQEEFVPEKEIIVGPATEEISLQDLLKKTTVV